MEPSLRGKKRVAFFGGSFDPPHQGHLSIARAACAALDLDRVLFAPVGAQPLKPNGPTASFDDRMAMTGLAIANDAAFALSRIDAPKPSHAPNYTADTLRELRAELPSDGQLFCLMGADSFRNLRHWHCAAKIPLIATLIVASRPGQPLDDLNSILPAGLTIASSPPPPSPSRSNTQPATATAGSELVTATIANSLGETAPLYLLPGLQIEVSASQIREEISGATASKQDSQHSPDPAAEILPASVRDYIRTHRLYR